MYLIISIVLFFAQTFNPEYTIIQGKVTNITVENPTFSLFGPNGFKSEVAINANGEFTDTVEIAAYSFQFKIGDEYGSIYLKPNENIRIETNYANFDEEMKFIGDNESTKISNVLIQNYNLMNEYLSADALELPSEKFDSVMLTYNNAYQGFKRSNASIPAEIWENLDSEYKNNATGFRTYFDGKKAMQARFQGKVSDDFSFVDINGKTVKLSDFRGKYVYLDFWATWCGPCRREIPAMNELEAKYEGKNIEFISISIDKTDQKEKWSAFVKDNDMAGVQLFAGSPREVEFVKFFEVKGIPRYVLIDPQGIVINADAPRPSYPNLEKMLNSFDL